MSELEEFIKNNTIIVSGHIIVNFDNVKNFVNLFNLIADTLPVSIGNDVVMFKIEKIIKKLEERISLNILLIQEHGKELQDKEKPRNEIRKNKEIIKILRGVENGI